ncbi:MAG: sulfurtransferase-like selenium metabolism protein YedF [Peptococcaceae bacterium]|jgi:selenium metabolism protein YedF|nr:sulfurtransferase-like selenium metabolism protein YedF [Peptococcaceae bacterium]
MNEKRLDCRGLACPHPVIQTRKALEDPEVEAVVILVDNAAARENVSLFARNGGYGVGVTGQGGLWEIRVQKKDGERPAAPAPGDGPVYLVTSNQFGQGSPELGEVLIKSLLVALAEDPPATLVFLNTGVFLAVAGSSVLPQLEALKDKGTEILCCGTCLKYYRLEEKPALGRVSNMLEITERLHRSGRVITVA